MCPLILYFCVSKDNLLLWAPRRQPNGHTLRIWRLVWKPTNEPNKGKEVDVVLSNKFLVCIQRSRFPALGSILVRNHNFTISRIGVCIQSYTHPLQPRTRWIFCAKVLGVWGLSFRSISLVSIFQIMTDHPATNTPTAWSDVDQEARPFTGCAH